MTELQLSAHQRDVVEWVRTGRGSAIVVAVAGAGKTTTIVEAAREMTGSVAMMAFNKKMGDELKVRTRELNHVRSGTVHGFGFGALRRRFPEESKRRDWVDGKKLFKLFDQVVMTRLDKNTTTGTDRAERLKFMEGHAPFVVGAASLAKQRGIGFLSRLDDLDAWYEMIDHFGLEQALPENGDGDLDLGVEMAVEVLRLNNQTFDVIDFDDMVYLPLVLNLRLFQNDWVVIDEAQDTNPTRRALAKKMLRPGGRLVAVGDPHQAIYGFTGADNDALDQIKRDFSAIKLPLTASFRCSRAVVDYARQWVSHITSHLDAVEGRVSQADLVLDPPRESDEGFDEFRLKVDRNSVTVPTFFTPDDAILCRNNAPLVDLCFALIRRGVAAKIEGREIGRGLIALANRWKSAKNLTTLRDRLETYLKREVDKAMAKGQEEKADRITDQVETLLVLIAKTEADGGTKKADLVKTIEDLFDDDTRDKPVLTLSSIHAAKGLEWDRVYLLNRTAYMPSRFARQVWQQDQETNLIYVAVTRAKNELVELTWAKEHKG